MKLLLAHSGVDVNDVANKTGSTALDDVNRDGNTAFYVASKLWL